jgi:tryptophanyl-tRNA synthetase
MGPGVANLLTIYQAFGEKSNDEMRAEFSGMRYGDLKKRVAGMVIAKLEPLQAEYRRIVAEQGYLDGILREGKVRAEPVANQTVATAKSRMGLYRSLG